MRISFRTATVGALALAMLSTLVPPAAAAVSTGWLDRTFGGDGKVLTNVGGDDTGEAVAVQADGKIVTAGVFQYNALAVNSSFLVARYNNDGSLDTSFGNAGKVTVKFGAASSDTATGRSYYYNPLGRPDGTGGMQLLFFGGYYNDRFRRTADGWRIAERVEETAWVEGSLPGAPPQN